MFFVCVSFCRTHSKHIHIFSWVLLGAYSEAYCLESIKNIFYLKVNFCFAIKTTSYRYEKCMKYMAPRLGSFLVKKFVLGEGSIFVKVQIFYSTVSVEFLNFWDSSFILKYLNERYSAKTSPWKKFGFLLRKQNEP